jgi:hypothetical protein
MKKKEIKYKSLYKNIEICIWASSIVEVRKIVTIHLFIHSMYIYWACYMPDVEVIVVKRVDTIPAPTDSYTT